MKEETRYDVNNHAKKFEKNNNNGDAYLEKNKIIKPNIFIHDQLPQLNNEHSVFSEQALKQLESQLRLSDQLQLDHKQAQKETILFKVHFDFFSNFDVNYLGARWVMVMRHGHRIDDDENGNNSRFDPNPGIRAISRREARYVGQSLYTVIKNKYFKIDEIREKDGKNLYDSKIEEYIKKIYIVSSPFLRCKQTALALAQGLYGSCGKEMKVYYDARLSEIFNSTKIEGAEMVEEINRNISEDNKFIQSITVDKENVLPFVDVEDAIRIPRWGEKVSEAYARFQGAFIDITTKAAIHGCNVIIVSHGDAVSAVMKHVFPRQTVYSTEYLCYVMFNINSDQKYNFFHRNGVEWMEDVEINELSPLLPVSHSSFSLLLQNNTYFFFVKVIFILLFIFIPFFFIILFFEKK